MYTRHSTNDGGYGGLGNMWFNGADPEKYIPKQPREINKGDLVWGSPGLRWVEELTKLEKQNVDRTSPKKVWWTPTGPRYGEKIHKGKRSEVVNKPKKKYKANVKVVRDLPILNLPPIEMPEGAQEASAQAMAKLQAETESAGFGETGSKNTLMLVVLGLLIFGLLYNRHR